jgi:hypothetical protein
LFAAAMMLRPFATFSTVSLLLLGTLPDSGLADQILKTSGFSTCLSNASITVQRSDVEYNNDKKQVTFNVAGTSGKSMNVTAEIRVTAYGTEVYKNSFNPCDKDAFVEQLCPGMYSTSSGLVVFFFSPLGYLSLSTANENPST